MEAGRRAMEETVYLEVVFEEGEMQTALGE